MPGVVPPDQRVVATDLVISLYYLCYALHFLFKLGVALVSKYDYFIVARAKKCSKALHDGILVISDNREVRVAATREECVSVIVDFVGCDHKDSLCGHNVLAGKLVVVVRNFDQRVILYVLEKIVFSSTKT